MAHSESELPDARRATPDTLRRRLRMAPREFLAAALENPRMGRAEMRLLLTNHNADASLLRRIGEDARWMRHGDLRRRIAGHPLAPPALARRLIPGLSWRELADLQAAPHTPPRVRRDAERALRARIPDLALGERVTLARSATRAVVPSLLESTEARVLEGLLDNPQLTASDAIFLARAHHSPPGFLRRLSDHSRWGGCREVRLALLRNARTPPAVALAVARRLDRSDLSDLVTDARAPRLVRVGAERWLGTVAKSGPAPGPEDGSGFARSGPARRGPVGRRE